ncbi:MAG: hypothetical protein DI556_06600 [Rhodovulum sulfidophilum]|uniref:MmgE/PrpD family protein n=1 Tax=Rhodovulum sulfidophilum TaxID=35806 RepID=A0A2W5NBF4_RHOSU|nr:MAG: hypothetical protein DI556_06600 [Rhodovulum sulfidophilum]
MTTETLSLPDTGDLTPRVAGFAARLRAEDLPAGLRADIGLHLLDTLACAAAGARLPIAAEARGHARAMGNAAGPAPLIGAADRTSPMMAAFANAFAANALDYDDGFEHDGKGMGHPGASLVAAALAALGRGPVSGGALVAALAAGTEINNRLILSVQPSAERFHEVYGIGQHQAIGAAVVYARLSGLPAERMETALGLAASLTPVPSLHKYNWRARPIITLKDFVAPAAQAGVQAVELARAGFTGPRGVFDGPTGFWRMVGSDRFDAEALVADLGRVWRAEEGAFKTYPACRWLAPALEAFEIARERAATGAGIVRISVRSFADVGRKLADPRPRDAIDAQFSLPHLLACLAAGLPAGLPWFTPAALADPALHALADRVTIETDAAMDAAMRGPGRRPSAAVAIDFADGSRAEAEVAAPRGGALRPITAAVVRDKAGRLFGQSGLDISERTLAELAASADVMTDLAPLFRGPAGG